MTSWQIVRIVAGIFILLSLALGVPGSPLFVSPWWLAFTGFVGGAMVWFAATGYCIMANGLYWLGAEPRLAPERAAPGPTGRDPAPAVHLPEPRGGLA